jgi:hypothetical protein
MAHGAAVKMRLFNLTGKTISAAGAITGLNEVVRNLKNAGYSGIQVIKIHYAGTLSNGFTEIGAPNSAAFDGTATEAAVYLDSDAAGDTKPFNVIGLDNGKIVDAPTTMTGTDGVATTETWTRIMHGYLPGTADAVGNIYVQDNASGDTKYLQCAAGAVDTEGSAIYVPDNHGVILCVDKFIPLTALTAASDLGLLKVAYTQFNNNNDESDYDYETFSISQSHHINRTIVSPHVWESDDSGDSKIMIYESYIGNALNAEIELSFVIFDRTGGLS